VGAVKHAEEYRKTALVRPLVKRLLAEITTLNRPVRIMEVCGTHTMAIFQSGLKSLLPKELELVSGPGCPVCVTAGSHMDYFIEIARAGEINDGGRRKKVRLAIFGDLFRVPGNTSSLAAASAAGALVSIVYSPMDALKLAIAHPDEVVIFAGVGFETTSPTIAATLLAAERGEIDNFLVAPCQKTMLKPLDVLFADPELRLDALLCPGHVCTIIGVNVWQPLAEKFHLASVVAGFEAADLLEALLMIITQLQKGEAKVENAYPRAVHKDGNPRAQAMVAEVFEPCDTLWRGLGILPGSGLAIREKYRRFDAGRIFPFDPVAGDEKSPKGCRCGEVLRGRISPQDCPLFGRACTPSQPIGPCMVSSEGVCAAHYKYGENNV
jgi:hydrogenase expression/formation protein HypD